MSLRESLTDFSKGDQLWLFWRLFRARQRVKLPPLRAALTFLCNRSAHHHGGYVGCDAVFEAIPSLPHGLHGVYISRYAHIGAGCRIYQNVTIGEVDHRAPHIGQNCLIGAGAVLVGGIQIGDGARIGAGVTVRVDVPDGCTAVAPPPRIWKGSLEETAPSPDA